MDITPKLSDAELAEVNGGVISDEIMGYLDLIPKYHADNLRKILEVDGELQFLNRFWPILSAYQKGNQSSVVRMAYQRLSLHQGPNNGSR